MINPVESGLDLFSAIVRDMFKTDYNYGIYKNYNMLQESGKNYNMRTHNIILQGHEKNKNHWGQYPAILTEQAWSITDSLIVWSKINVFLQDPVGKMGSSYQSSQEKQRIRFILPPCRSIHITKIDFAFCCPECMCHNFFSSHRGIYQFSKI